MAYIANGPPSQENVLVTAHLPVEFMKKWLLKVLLTPEQFTKHVLSWFHVSSLHLLRLGSCLQSLKSDKEISLQVERCSW